MNTRIASTRRIALLGPIVIAVLILSCWSIALPAVAFADEVSAAPAPAAEAPEPQQEAKAAPAEAEQAEPATEQSKAEANQANKETADNSKDADKTEETSSDEPAAEKPGGAKASAKVQTATAATSDKKTAPKRDKVRLALLTLKENLPESTAQVSPFGDTQLDLREAINRLEKASKDKSIAGVVLDIQNPSVGRGKIEEIRAAIARFRASGKKTYAMMETAMPSDYLIASACDEIVMPETGIVVLPGIHAEATFYKGLLAKLGIEAEFIHIGDYKGAGEPFAREQFSEPVRRNLTSVIDSLYDDLVTTIVKDRPLSIAQAKEIIDTGLVTAKRAKELGLIDRVAYSETLRDELGESYDADPLVYVKNYGQKKVDTDFSGPMGFFKLLQAMMGGGSKSGARQGKKIAIVYAVGPIMSGESEGGMFGGQTMGSTTIVEALRKANDDDHVAAIVLRIDSPGGSAIASDLIWNQTQVIDKPIVASMGDTAASGGYYIAMGTDRIIATPATITGSIGVVGGKFAIRGLYDKIGITTETIERGKNSGLFGSSGKWTESQREVIKAMMEDIYDQFTSKAAEGRNMPVERLRELAGGRIYTGRQAKDNGLVDQLGTLDDAVNEAKKLAGIDADTDVKIMVLPEPTNFFESLFGDMDAEKEVRLDQGLEFLAPELANVARRALHLRRIFEQPAALVMPFELDIK